MVFDVAQYCIRRRAVPHYKGLGAESELVVHET